LNNFKLGPADDEDFYVETNTISKTVFLYKGQITAYEELCAQDSYSKGTHVVMCKGSWVGFINSAKLYAYFLNCIVHAMCLLKLFLKINYSM
jgi:hypothetical protein